MGKIIFERNGEYSIHILCLKPLSIFVSSRPFFYKNFALLSCTEMLWVDVFPSANETVLLPFSGVDKVVPLCQTFLTSVCFLHRHWSTLCCCTPDKSDSFSMNEVNMSAFIFRPQGASIWRNQQQRKTKFAFVKGNTHRHSYNPPINPSSM